ncbi:hypothetical protein RHCRD62_30020 [Rhodococcus sp. RD6.2]|nr:hypothetical protein RHCRD62_30020 [Rhodococcus sp. RD6.2]
MRSSTECTAPAGVDHPPSGPSNAVPDAIRIPGQIPFPSVRTGAIETGVITHARGPVFDHPSVHGSAALATPGAVTDNAAPNNPAAATDAIRCEIFMTPRMTQVPPSGSRALSDGASRR